MTRPDLKATAEEVNELVADLRPLLVGRHRSVQWAVLAELIAWWLIEHAAVRSVLLEPLLSVHIKTVRRLVDGHIANNRDEP